MPLMRPLACPGKRGETREPAPLNVGGTAGNRGALFNPPRLGTQPREARSLSLSQFLYPTLLPIVSKPLKYQPECLAQGHTACKGQAGIGLSLLSREFDLGVTPSTSEESLWLRQREGQRSLAEQAPRPCTRLVSHASGACLRTRLCVFAQTSQGLCCFPARGHLPRTKLRVPG